MAVRDGTEQRAPVVADDDLRLVTGVPLGDLLDQQPQQRRLAGLALAEDEEERVGLEVDEDRLQVVLVDGEGNPALGVP